VATMPSSYRLADIPESSSEASRYFIPATPGGFAQDSGTVFADAVQALCIAIRSSRKPLAPLPVKMALSQVVKGQDGSYSVGPRGEVSLVQDAVNERPGALWGGNGLKAGRLLDSFLRREVSYSKAPDSMVWKAAAAAAAAMRLDGADLRRLNDYLAVALLARAGFAGVKDSALPHPFPAPTRRSSNPVTLAKEKAGSRG
jgi:hypothetical protein